MRKNNQQVKDKDQMIKEMFEKVDVNKDGKVTLEELKMAFRKYGD